MLNLTIMQYLAFFESYLWNYATKYSICNQMFHFYYKKLFKFFLEFKEFLHVFNII